MDKLKIDRPVIVEGKYDKIKLSQIIDTQIITTEGFRIFRGDEKTALIRRLAEKNGIIVLTDSDGAGLVIRNYFNSLLGRSKVTHLYVPEIEGKEKRKKTRSKAGLLGVEGIDTEILHRLFEPFAQKKGDNETLSASPADLRKITKTDFYLHGLSGGEGSSEKRKKLAALLDLPTNMSADALICAMNLLYKYDQNMKYLDDLGA